MRIAVVGAGIVGLAVTYHLVRAGEQVDCFEAGQPMGARSRGDTRIFRLAHDRAPLVQWAWQARDAWQEWSSHAGVELLADQGTVVSGDVHAVQTAMAAAGAPFEIRSAVPALPARGPVGPFLVDPLGGVIRAAATGRFLVSAVKASIRGRTVTSVQVRGGSAVLSTADGRREVYDSVVVAAGTSTPALVAPVGISAPTRLEHHVRLTFPLRDVTAQPPCWLDRSEAWRAGFRSYGHLAAAGRWAVGGTLPAEDPARSLTREEVAQRTTRLLTAYINEYVTGCEPAVVDAVACDVTTGLGDGVSTARSGPILAVWGENLFKLAPVVGAALATAAAAGGDGDLPEGVGSAHSVVP